MCRAGPSATLDQLTERELNLQQIAACHIICLRPSWIRRFGVPRRLRPVNLARFQLWDDEFPDKPGQYLYCRSIDAREWSLVSVQDVDGDLHAVFGRGAFFCKVNDLDGVWARTPDIPK